MKSLDDVVVHYEQGHRDSEGLLRETDYYQVKYHVDYRGSMGFKTLCNPDFINASSYSFLQRAYDAWKKFGRESLRIFLYNIWGIDGTDALGELVSANDGRILVEKWRDCTSRSKFGKVRECWRKHLKCSVAELEMFLLSLRLVQGGTFELERLRLDSLLRLAGLKVFPPSNPLTPYADLARSFIKREKIIFSRQSLIRECKASEVWNGGPQRELKGRKLVIRSYARGTEGIEEWCNSKLDLLSCFNDRVLRNNKSWIDDIARPVINFLEKELAPGMTSVLWLPAHYTVSALAGYALDARKGVSVTLRQMGVSGAQYWTIPSSVAGSKKPSCICCDDVALSDAGTDLAITISASQNIADDVHDYIEASGLPIVAMRSISTECCGASVIAGAEQSIQMVDDIVLSVRKFCRDYKNRGVVHIFYAVPSSMVFMLGQRMRMLGQVQLYEHDPNAPLGQNYTPSIKLPIAKG